MVWWTTEFGDTAIRSTSVLHYSPTSWCGGPRSSGILLYVRRVFYIILLRHGVVDHGVRGYCYTFDECSTLFSYFMVWWTTEFGDTAIRSTSVLHYSPTSWCGGPWSSGILLYVRRVFYIILLLHGVVDHGIRRYCYNIMFDECSILFSYFMVWWTTEFGVLLHIRYVYCSISWCGGILLAIYSRSVRDVLGMKIGLLQKWCM